METTEMSLGGWMDEEVMVYKYNKTLIFKKEEHNLQQNG